MKKLLQQKLLLILAAAVILSACNDPVFDAISLEVPPVRPLINGAPTNMVVFSYDTTIINDSGIEEIVTDSFIYAASGRILWRYDGTRWERASPQPSGRIIQLAATNNFLYALTFEDSRDRVTFTLRRFNRAIWESITDVEGTIRNIHAVNNALFINTEVSETNRTAHRIFYIYEDQINPEDTSLTAVILQYNNVNAEGEISGVAWNGTYYFIPASYIYEERNVETDEITPRRRSGVFVVDSSGAVLRRLAAPVFDSDANRMPVDRFMGIINLENAANTIVVIARNGELFTVTDSVISDPIRDVSMGNHRATGALAIWRNPDYYLTFEDGDPHPSPSLLLAGRQSRTATTAFGFTQGYLEIYLDANGIKIEMNDADPPRNTNNFREPGLRTGVTVSSVHRHERYMSTLGRHVVNHIFQAPFQLDPDMTLFASTQLNGLWSYRDRGTTVPEWQWNAENNRGL